MQIWTGHFWGNTVRTVACLRCHSENNIEKNIQKYTNLSKIPHLHWQRCSSSISTHQRSIPNSTVYSPQFHFHHTRHPTIQVQINMSSIESTLGGDQYGYLGISMCTSRYEHISNTPFSDNCPYSWGGRRATWQMNQFQWVDLVVVRRVLLIMIYEAIHEYSPPHGMSVGK